MRVGAEGERVFASTPPGGPASDWLPAMLERNFVERTMLLRRGMLLRLGGYDPAFRCYEDWELSIRMLRSGVIAAYAPGPLYRYIKTAGASPPTSPRLLNAYGQLYERHHRPLADTGNPPLPPDLCPSACGPWAVTIWTTAMTPRGVRCLLTSLRYDFAPAKILRGASQRVFKSLRGRGSPPPPKRDDDAPSSID